MEFIDGNIFPCELCLFCNPVQRKSLKNWRVEGSWFDEQIRLFRREM